MELDPPLEEEDVELVLVVLLEEMDVSEVDVVVLLDVVLLDEDVEDVVAGATVAVAVPELPALSASPP